MIFHSVILFWKFQFCSNCYFVRFLAAVAAILLCVLMPVILYVTAHLTMDTNPLEITIPACLLAIGIWMPTVQLVLRNRCRLKHSHRERFSWCHLPTDRRRQREILALSYYTPPTLSFVPRYNPPTSVHDENVSIDVDALPEIHVCDIVHECSSESLNLSTPPDNVTTEASVVKFIHDLLTSFNKEAALVRIRNFPLSNVQRRFTIRALLRISVTFEPSRLDHELVSDFLLSLLENKIFDEDDFFVAFRDVFTELEDFVGASLSSTHTVAGYVARGVFDGLLPLNFLAYLRGYEVLLKNTVASRVIEAACLELQNLYSADKALKRCFDWTKPSSALSSKLRSLTQEYLDGRYLGQIVSALRSMNVPWFHHELVFQAGALLLKPGGNSFVPPVSLLLAVLYHEGILDISSVASGFERLDQLVKRFPSDSRAGETLCALLQSCCNEGLSLEL